MSKPRFGVGVDDASCVSSTSTSYCNTAVDDAAKCQCNWSWQYVHDGDDEDEQDDYGDEENDDVEDDDVEEEGDDVDEDDDDVEEEDDADGALMSPPCGSSSCYPGSGNPGSQLQLC